MIHRRISLVFACLLLALLSFAPLARSADFFVAPSGDDGGMCSQSAPCRSFDRAYRVAQPGAVVEVAGGDYGAQTIGNDPTKTTADDVRFVPATGTQPHLADLTVFGSHVEIAGVTSDGGWSVKPGTDDVTFRDVHASTWYSVRDASNVWVIGGGLGPGLNNTPQVTGSTNVTFDGVWFHDWIKTDSSSHVDCMGVFGGTTNLTIRNSRFQNCEHFDILFDESVINAPNKGVLVENNFLSCCRSGYYSVLFSQHDGDAIVRHNSADLGMAMDTEKIGSGTVVFDSNIVPSISSFACDHATWKYNLVSSGGTCNGTNKRDAPGFVDPRGFDFHLKAGSAAIDAGNPTSGPAEDIDGGGRIGAPDIGADEYGSRQGDGSGGGAGSPGAVVPTVAQTVPDTSKSGSGEAATSKPQPPGVRLLVDRRNMKALFRQGLVLRVRCDRACRVTVRLSVTRAISKRFHIGRLVASATARRSSVGVLRVRLRAQRKVRAKLAGRPGLHVLASVSATGSRGNRSVLQRTFVLP